MTDERISNVNPSKDQLTPSSTSLMGLMQAGAVTQRDIVHKEVNVTEEDQNNLDNQSEYIGQQRTIPEAARHELVIQAQSDDSPNVIVVDNEARIVNIQPSPGLSEIPTMEVAIRSGVMGFDQLAVPIPPTFDLREEWWAVTDQGQTGACVGFALADGVLRYMFTKTKQINPGERLSPRAIWISAKETDEFNEWPTTFIETEGTSLKAALEVTKRWGCIRENIMPFNTLYTKDARSYYRQAAALRILGYYNLGKNIEAWKRWISTTGPILAAINVDRTFQNATTTKGDLERYDVYTLMGGHAICICGYTKDRIIIRNSWGTSWGDNGYCYASYDWCVKAVIEAYGISI